MVWSWRALSPSQFRLHARGAGGSPSKRLILYCNSVSLRFIRPCSPIRATKPPAGDAWLHEPKLDGYRLQIVKSGRLVRLYSRNGHEWTKRFATLAEELAAIPGRSAVIDAELCFLTGAGAPDFAGLQLALRSRHHHKLTVFAFDLLHRDGVDLARCRSSSARIYSRRWCAGPMWTACSWLPPSRTAPSCSPRPSG